MTSLWQSLGILISNEGHLWRRFPFPKWCSSECFYMKISYNLCHRIWDSFATTQSSTGFWRFFYSLTVTICNDATTLILCSSEQNKASPNSWEYDVNSHIPTQNQMDVWTTEIRNIFRGMVCRLFLVTLSYPLLKRTPPYRGGQPKRHRILSPHHSYNPQECVVVHHGVWWIQSPRFHQHFLSSVHIDSNSTCHQWWEGRITGMNGRREGSGVSNQHQNTLVSKIRWSESRYGWHTLRFYILGQAMMD